MMLHWHHTGPFVKYDNGFLHVEDLNPELRTKWRMSRSDMLRFGLRCLVAALRGPRADGAFSHIVEPGGIRKARAALEENK